MACHKIPFFLIASVFCLHTPCSHPMTNIQQKQARIVQTCMDGIIRVINDFPATYMNQESGAIAINTSASERISTAINGQIPALLSMIEERLYNSFHQSSTQPHMQHMLIVSQSFISLIAHLTLALGLYSSQSTQTSSADWLFVMSIKNAVLAFFDVLRIINRSVLNESLVLIDNDQTQRWFWGASIVCNLLHLIFNDSLSFMYNIISIETCMIEFMRQMFFDYEIGNTPTRAMHILWRKLIRYMCGEHND